MNWLPKQGGRKGQGIGGIGDATGTGNTLDDHLHEAPGRWQWSHDTYLGEPTLDSIGPTHSPDL